MGLTVKLSDEGMMKATQEAVAAHTRKVGLQLKIGYPISYHFLEYTRQCVCDRVCGFCRFVVVTRKKGN